MERQTVQCRSEAVENLVDIAACVLQQSQNIQTSEGYVDRICRRREKFGDALFGGVAATIGAWNSHGRLREEHRYVILYIVEGSAVCITDILSGSCDYETLLTRP
ncbi:hypothetical protein PY650_01540 [Rhizobium calliandrae]|uniref:Type II toxin-antitoxin system RelE/ParE family toxin n=1 Tax=Rhizobium calliandrae TaxID=1312182 RepID=A0ABT7K8S7_9HYPH|nr:hypothetical protein [Rhizobium calliandrae]MDL2404358.1 hypothetical protein [Rhizobium calliandrae]